MSLSDCERCWDTPCTCGYKFRKYTPEALAEFIASTLNYKTVEERTDIIVAATCMISGKPTRQ